MAVTTEVLVLDSSQYVSGADAAADAASGAADAMARFKKSAGQASDATTKAGTSTVTLTSDSSELVNGMDAMAGAVDDATEALARFKKKANQAGNAAKKAGKSAERGGKRFRHSFRQTMGKDQDWRRLGKNQKKAGGGFDRIWKSLRQIISPANKRGIGGTTKGIGKLGKAGGVAGGALAGAAIVLGGFVLAMATAAKLAAPFFKVAGAATIAGDRMEQALDQVTGGRGEEAIGVMKRLSKNLNLPVQKVTDSFIALRKEGINNIDSESLIKLHADLVAVGKTTGEADEEIDKLTKAIKGGADAGDAISKVADKFGAVGDGANASAGSVFTLEGALKRAGLAGDRFVDSLADWASPALDKAGLAIANVVEHLEKSDVAKSALSAISAGMNAMVEAGEGFIDTLMPAIEALEEPLDDLSEAFRDSAGASGDARNAGAKLGSLLGILVGGLGLVIKFVAGVIKTYGALSDATSWVSDAIGDAIDAVSDGASDMYDEASNFISGIPQAVMDGIGATVEAVEALADKAVAALKSKLGIASPSKVATSLGHNFGDSFTDAINDSMPKNIAMAAPANTNAFSAGRAPSADGGGRGGVIELHVHIAVAGSNASADDIALAGQRGAEQALRLAGLVA